ncbi:MAG: CinA family protein [Streptosporangiales bacterium]
MQADGTLAAHVHAALRAAGATIAVAESLTGGLVGGRLSAEPGASVTFRGGVIAYATAVKHEVLGVDGELLARVGAVHPDVARAMAVGVRRLLGATYGLALTGVAGPDPQDGQPPGTLHLAVACPLGTATAAPRLPAADRSGARDRAVDAALELVLGLLRGEVHATS